MTTRVSSPPPRRISSADEAPSGLQHLSHTSLRLLNEALPTLYAPVTPHELPARLAEVISTLVPGAMHGCTRVERNSGERRTIILSPTPPRPEEALATFSEHWTQFPLREHRELTGSGAALAVSDLVSAQGFRRLDLYHAYYRPLGLEDDLSINLWDAQTKLCVCVLRERRGFSAQERHMFDALRPHFLQAHKNAAAADIASLVLAPDEVEQFEDASQRWVIDLSAAGQVRFWTQAAQRKLSEYEPIPSPTPGHLGQLLPERVRNWMACYIKHAADRGAKRPLVLRRRDAEGQARALHLSVVFDPVRSRRLLVLEERQLRPEPASDPMEELSVDALRSALALSPREAEVLLWVAQGKTNPEVALILGIQPYTVRTHLEHIFQKLGVETRHAASLRALEAMRTTRV